MIYDDFPYDDFPFAPTHPDRLGTVAGLFGLHAAPSAACRVLELGCGLGGNLLGMAVALPESHFLGVDLSETQIDRARAAAAACGLTNVEFRVADIMALGPGLGRYDYVICHGVWSWVEPAVREKIFSLCRDLLLPHGVAIISYNTLPGWHIRGALRSMLLRAVPAEGAPEERAALARTYLEQFIAHAPVKVSLAARMIRHEIETILPLSNRYLFHEHLAAVNEPVWFSDFVAQATAADLQYLGDAEPGTMMPDRLGPDAVGWLRQTAKSQVDLEAGMDTLNLRYFRRTLLCHKEIRLSRELGADQLAGHWISCTLTPNVDVVNLLSGAAVAFTAPNGVVISTAQPLLKAALVSLQAHRPQGLILEDLAADATRRLGRTPSNADVVALAGSVLELLAQGYAEVCREGPRYVAVPGPCPQTTALVRRQLEAGRDGVCNLRHVSVAVDPLERLMLGLLDGSNDRTTLVAAAAAAVDRGDFEVNLDDLPVTDAATLADVVDSKLERLARMALLVA